MQKRICDLLVSLLLICAVSVTAFAADTATLTIEPEQTELTADGQELKVTYTITVTPPEGKEIGVFSFRLKPDRGMTLPTEFLQGEQQVITVPNTGLRYNSGNGKGVFQTYEYTPESNFFAAVGSREGKRMTEAAAVMTITATLPADASGAYVLDAEFTAAPDGSGETYVGKVVSPPVSVTAPQAKTDGGTTPTAEAKSDKPAAAEQPQGGVTVTPEQNVPADDRTPAEEPAQQETAADVSRATVGGAAQQETAAADGLQSAEKKSGLLPVVLALIPILIAAGVQLALPGGWKNVIRRQKERSGAAQGKREGRK